MLNRGEITQKTFDEWESVSPPYDSLPERVGNKGVRSMAAKKKTTKKKATKRKPMSAAQKKAFAERMARARKKKAGGKKKTTKKKASNPHKKKRSGTKKGGVRKTARRAYEPPKRSKKEIEAAARARKKAADLKELASAFDKAVKAGDLTAANRFKRKIEAKDKMTGVYGHCSAHCLEQYEKLKRRGTSGATGKQRALIKRLGG